MGEELPRGKKKTLFSSRLVTPFVRDDRSTGHELDASKAFTALALFNLLRFPLLMLPFTVNNLVEATVSLRRMQQFLSAEEIDKNAVKREPSQPESEQPNGGSGHEANCAILIKNGEFSWGTDPNSDEAENDEGSKASQGTNNRGQKKQMYGY